MLQQTQVATVVPYYHRWLRRFPTLRALARAESDEVLRVWEGLGYYARAHNLRRAAREVVARHRGRVPRDVQALRALPGVGRYTAGAIASIAFGLDAAVLDGNIKRVLARVFDVRDDVRSSRGERRLWDLAERLVPKGRAGAYNQALMDLGATVCLARAPRCPACPLAQMCRARRLGVQSQRPVARLARKLPHYQVAAAIVRRGPRVLITQRPARGLLPGLWSFPSVRALRQGQKLLLLKATLRDQLGLRVQVGRPRVRAEHAYSHFRITLQAFECTATGKLPAGAQAEARWVHLADLARYPMGKADGLIRSDLRSEIRSASYVSDITCNRTRSTSYKLVLAETILKDYRGPLTPMCEGDNLRGCRAQ